MNRTAMSYTSAVVAVARWIDAHEGRTPTKYECRAVNDLPHRVTLQYVCGGVRHAVSAALDMLVPTSASGMTPLSMYLCGISAATRTSAKCLRCDKTIAWCPSQRLCTKCRWHINERGADNDLDYDGEAQPWRYETGSVVVRKWGDSGEWQR